MDEVIADLRARVEELRQQGAPPRTRYSPEFRAQVLAVVREHQARGFSLRGVAQAVGLKDSTVARWLQTETRPEAALRRVVVELEAESQSEAARIVIFAGRLRIEGLGLPDVVQLVRALA